MINLPYPEIVKKIVENAQVSEEDVEQRVKEKMDQLSGLISKEGAAYIVANDLGVQLVQAEGMKQIKDIYPGMKSVETAGKVMRIFPINEFERNGNKGKVGSFIIADETGEMRITAWNDMTSVLSDFSQGGIVKIQDGYVKDNQGRTEIHLNKNTKVQVNPEGVEINVEVPSQQQTQQSQKRKSISELSENENGVQILGTVVQIFDPKFFPTCQSCGKKLTQNGEEMSCPEHGNVNPKYNYVLNIVVDDGTDNIRAVFFRENVLKLTRRTEEQMEEIRQAPDQFEQIRTELLGETVKVTGRVTRNQMFDRLELMGNDVEVDVNPDEEVERLKGEKKEKGEEIPSIDEL